MQKLLEKIKRYYDEEQAKIVLQAYSVAEKNHKGQKRDSGEDYIIHPVCVADILIDMGLDYQAVCAGLLHDVVEDTPVTAQELKEMFGEQICALVDGVTKLDKLEFKSKEEEQAENLRKMFFAMAKDIRVILIKLADRLHNMRSLSYLSKERQEKMSRETIDIYAPLAGRLGISPVKCELEDLCLRYLEPEFYYDLVEKLTLKRAEREEQVRDIIVDVNSMLEELNIRGEVFGRPKHLYSIYKKMKNQNKTLEQIFDLIAVRIIVENVKDCYNILGTIHTKWTPIPGRIKDYIAMPKPNMYQSLHTTVITNHGMTFEIQIRTYEMHRVAEYGIAAHWKYKEGRDSSNNFDQKLSWLREIIDSQIDLKDATEFMDSLKGELFSGEVLVFTPQGDVISLPEGSTPLDFAYHIHSQIGNKCVGAKINSKMVPITTALNNGDVVEIVTSNQAKGPSWDWLNIVKTASAKSKIRQFFKREMKDENIKKGKSMLEHEAKRRGYSLSELFSKGTLSVIQKKYSFANENEIYAAVGYGAFTTNQILLKLIDKYNLEINKRQPKLIIAENNKNSSKDGEGVVVKGHTDLLVKFSKCCNPVPGDKIVGFISRGRGIIIHRADCPNLKNVEQVRLIEAEWAEVNKHHFTASVQINADNSDGLIAKVTTLISTLNYPLVFISAKVEKGNKAVINLTVKIYKAEDLELLINKLMLVSEINEVFRTTN